MIIIKCQDSWLKISDVRFIPWDLDDIKNSEVSEHLFSGLYWHFLWWHFVFLNLMLRSNKRIVIPTECMMIKAIILPQTERWLHFDGHFI